MRRAINQDSFAVHLAETRERWQDCGHLFLVADGMGAHAAGELASKLATELIPHQYLKASGAPAETLHTSITQANAEIFRRGQANIEFRSMGTTCSVLTLLPEGAVVAHVGDSRVYQVHGDHVFQLTFDHSLVWEMQAAGEVTDETARSGAIPKNVITRSLGPNANVQIDLEGPFPVRRGDCFLLCSDGLTGQVTDEELAMIMKSLPPEEACQLLVDISNLRGGPDNITAVVVRVPNDHVTTSSNTSATLKRNGPKRKFSPALGVVTAVCFSAALLLLLLGNMPLGIVTGTLGFVALATGLTQVLWQPSSNGNPSGRYGNGPYRQFPIKAGADLVTKLGGTVESLREAAKERGWKIDWKALDDQLEKARKYQKAGDSRKAVAAAGRVVIDLMAQIRRQRNDEASDSAVDL
ncbi:MAG: protein phosphatase 2C domain-containing protein [Aureliella sp.]